MEPSPNARKWRTVLQVVIAVGVAIPSAVAAAVAAGVDVSGGAVTLVVGVAAAAVVLVSTVQNTLEASGKISTIGEGK
jgi:hypothetical protein